MAPPTAGAMRFSVPYCVLMRLHAQRVQSFNKKKPTTTQEVSGRRSDLSTRVGGIAGRPQGGESGTGPADESQRNAVEIDAHHVGCGCRTHRPRTRSSRWFLHLGFATNSLLREIELGLLDLHSDTISFDMSAFTVTVRLSASEGDP